MSQNARTYLIERFTEDARVLHERVATMRRGTKVPGPDAATSERMAEACEDVVAIIEDVEHAQWLSTSDLVATVIPIFEEHMKENQGDAAIRSVYAGAIARAREVAEAEQQDVT